MTFEEFWMMTPGSSVDVSPRPWIQEMLGMVTGGLLQTMASSEPVDPTVRGFANGFNLKKQYIEIHRIYRT